MTVHLKLRNNTRKDIKGYLHLIDCMFATGWTHRTVGKKQDKAGGH